MQISSISITSRGKVLSRHKYNFVAKRIKENNRAAADLVQGCSFAFIQKEIESTKTFECGKTSLKSSLMGGGVGVNEAPVTFFPRAWFSIKISLNVIERTVFELAGT